MNNKEYCQSEETLWEVIPTEDFADMVEWGGFNSYDSIGYFYDINKHEGTDIAIEFDPNWLRKQAKRFSHVIWYNK